MKRIKALIAALACISVPLVFIFIPAAKTSFMQCPGQGTYFTYTIPGFRFLCFSTGNFLTGVHILKRIGNVDFSLSVISSSGTSCAAYICPWEVAVYNGQHLIGSLNIKSTGEEIISSCISDFNNDNNDEMLLLLKSSGEKYGDTLMVLCCDNGLEEICRCPCKNVNPWKVQVCDVDGDGEKEVSLGVFTKAPFDPVFNKRPFIYNLKDNKLYPKWLGTRLSKPFDDYVFSDINEDGMDELIAVEILRDGRKILNSYRWKGFGFEFAGNSTTYNNISGISTEKNCVYAKVLDDKVWRVTAFKCTDEKLTEVK